MVNNQGEVLRQVIDDKLHTYIPRLSGTLVAAEAEGGDAEV